MTAHDPETFTGLATPAPLRDMPARKSAKPAKKPAKKPRKPSAKSSGRAGVPQAHGGVLVPGAGGGPQPGSGRPPSEVRRRALKAFDEKSLPELERLTLNAVADKDRIAAAKVLAQAGLSDAISKAEVRKALAATIETIRTTVPDRADALLGQIRPHWTAL